MLWIRSDCMKEWTTWGSFGSFNRPKKNSNSKEIKPWLNSRVNSMWKRNFPQISSVVILHWQSFYSENEYQTSTVGSSRNLPRPGLAHICWPGWLAVSIAILFVKLILQGSKSEFELCSLFMIIQRNQAVNSVRQQVWVQAPSIANNNIKIFLQVETGRWFCFTVHSVQAVIFLLFCAILNVEYSTLSRWF